jgi:CubicO group peptidase (beta-lactamase class C family)
MLWCADQTAPGAVDDSRAEAAAVKPVKESDVATPKAADGPPACPSGAGEWRPMAPPYDQIWPLIWAAGGIQSSTSDMTSWITRLVATDDVLDAEHRRLMQTPVTHSKVGIAEQFPRSLAASMVGYGLGLIVFEYDIGTGYGHTGNTPGYSSNSVYFPGHGNDFAMTIVAGESVVEVAADGSNAIATAIRATR